MDKSILKKFAIESRQDLMDKIKNKIKTFYIDEDFNSEQKGEIYVLSNEKHSLSLTNEEFKKRELLIKRIKELSLEQVIEEAAYTWFNRIIAIRYMEINDMLPLTRDNQSLGIRVLSSKDNTPDPEILKFTNLINPELDLDFKKEKYVELNDDNEKFKYVLLLICKKLGRVIPQVFDGITDYIDILIPDNLLNDTGFITKVIKEVPEANYSKVEIIGWLYQYYNQVEKDRVISAKKAYKKNEIAYATQLFTPDWIVKYMVENSLGRYWMEHSDNNLVPDNWKYYIREKVDKKEQLNPNEITFIDPCCGSGHILVYAFEVFYQMYVNAGYNKNDIPEKILKNNIFGLDIDDRAGQLSVLSVILKAREFDKNIFNKSIIKNINILSIQESNNIIDGLLKYIPEIKIREKAKQLLENFKNAKEIGSLLLLKNDNYQDLFNFLNKDMTIFGIELREKIIPLIKISNIISRKYDIVVTNPPYLNNSVMSSNLKEYIIKNYPDVKNDMFSAFIQRNSMYGKEMSYLGFMTPYVWMFISTYEKLRNHIIEKMDISSLIQLEYSALEEATVPICTFILANKNQNKPGNYYKLSEFTGGMDVQKVKFLEALNNKTDYAFRKNVLDYNHLSGKQIAFWASEKMLSIYKGSKTLLEYARPRVGQNTGDNNRFLRQWFEVDINKIKFGLKHEELQSERYKWLPYNKGGSFRKWYGNQDYIVNWENDGKEIKDFAVIRNHGKHWSRYIQNIEFMCRKGITWTFISSSKFATRYLPEGFICDVAGSAIFPVEDINYNLQAFLNSKLTYEILTFTNPTLNFQAGNIASLPVNEKIFENKLIPKFVEENIMISKEDWNSFETSWDFTRHPLLKPMTKVSTIRDSIANWNTYTYQQRSLLKHNEEELNKIFIDIYGLNDELTSMVDDKDITIRKEDKVRDIKSFISYAVGCMFGRYSLDEDGLIYAGGEFDINKYKTFKVDLDNIIPITDETYFGDDIVERFKTFIKTVYGDNTFNENMDYIAEALGKKGTETSEETIRRYFVNDFFNDHVKMYQKRPIYWLLDSGKKNGFKALVYMHRYNENLIPKARLDYLHRVQTTYEKLLSDVNYKLTTDLSMTDKKEAKNRQADLNAKLTEIKEYDEKIAHIANQRISIDLDDGVKVNYEKFKDILAKIK